MLRKTQNVKTNGLKNKVVVVAGGSRGIGEGIAVRCAMDGAHVVILARSITENDADFGSANTVVQKCNSVGGSALAIKCDLTQYIDVQNALKNIIEYYGHIDVLINNASAHWDKGTLDTDDKHYDLMYNVSLRSSFLLFKTFGPYLQETHGHLLTVSYSTNCRWSLACPVCCVYNV